MALAMFSVAATRIGPIVTAIAARPTVSPATLSISTLVHAYLMGTDERAFPVLEDGDQFIGLVPRSAPLWPGSPPPRQATCDHRVALSRADGDPGQLPQTSHRHLMAGVF